MCLTVVYWLIVPNQCHVQNNLSINRPSGTQIVSLSHARHTVPYFLFLSGPKAVRGRQDFLQKASEQDREALNDHTVSCDGIQLLLKISYLFV